MFVTVCIKTEYTPYSYRANFYQQCLDTCLKNGWALITNEYMKYHHKEMQDGISDRLLKEFELRKLSDEEYNDVEQYFIPDSIFEDKEKEIGSRTGMLSFLSTQSFELLENYVKGIIKEIKSKHPEEKIDGMFYCAESCKPFRNVCDELGIPLIPYCFSAIKIPHGYRQTLYYANLKGLSYNSNECKDRYHNYLKEGETNIPVFSNREIIALIGKERTLPLLQLMNHAPKYEMGVCCECYAVIPQFYDFNQYTDDDVFYECNELYSPDQIKVRSHALQLDHIQVDRSEVHNDAAPFILSCKRLTSVRSQITLKNLLWKRTAVMKKNTHAFSFMCETDYSSTKLADIKALNYFVFAYLIPTKLMFSKEYWEWRVSNPTETEIYKRHLSYYIEELHLKVDDLAINDESKRFAKLLKDRNCDEELIEILIKDDQNFDVDYDVASSKFVVNGKNHWRINKVVGDDLHCHIELNVDNIDSFDFYPIDDCAGFANLCEVLVNGKAVVVEKGFKYMKKVEGHYHIDLPKAISGPCIIDCKWQYKKIKDYLEGK